MQKTNEEIHWTRTRNLMFAHLAIWFFFGYVIHMFVNVLNQFTVPILKFPLGFYMAAQGSLIVFVVMLFVFAWQQDRIDRAQPDRDIPENDQGNDADHRQQGFEPLHVRRTSRWNTSRQCALMRTKSGSESVASVRGRAAS